MIYKIIKNIPLDLTKDGIFRRMGYGGRSRPPARDILEQFDQAMDLVEKHKLLKGNFIFNIQKIASISDDSVATMDGFVLPGGWIMKLMPDASHLAMAVCTIGDELETISRQLVKSENVLAGVMLDSVGSAAVDCLVEETGKYIRKQVEGMGLMSSSPISPGMPDLPLKAQQVLFNQLPVNKINMRLTSTHLMIPFKSCSIVYGLGKTMPNWSRESVCRACHLFKHCRYKCVI